MINLSVIRGAPIETWRVFPGLRFAPSGLRLLATAPFSHRLIDFVRRARRDRVSVHHEQHGETSVLAYQCDQFDDAALADERRHRLEVGVAHLPSREKLGDEVIRRSFIGRHIARPFAGRQGRDKRRTEARIQRLLAVRIPHVLPAPVARRQHDGNLFELARRRCLEAQIVAQRSRQFCHFGTTQIDVEGAGLRLAPLGDLPVGESALRRGKLIVAQRFEPMAAGRYRLGLGPRHWGGRLGPTSGRSGEALRMIRDGPIESSARASPALAEAIIGLTGGRLWPLSDCLLNPYTEPAEKWYRSAVAAPTIAPIMPAISNFMARLSAMAVPPGYFLRAYAKPASVSAHVPVK